MAPQTGLADKDIGAPAPQRTDGRSGITVRTAAKFAGLSLAALAVGLGVGQVVGGRDASDTRAVVVGGATRSTANVVVATARTGDASTTLTTVAVAKAPLGPTTMVLGPGPAPSLTSFAPAASVPFQLIASTGTSTSSTELIDVGTGERRVYAGGEAIVGASRVTSGGWLVWSNERVRFFGGNLDGPARVFLPPQSNGATIVGTPRALSSADGKSAWLIWGTSGQRVLQRVDLTTGATLAALEPTDDWYPVAAAGNGLVLANAPRNETLVVSGTGEKRLLPAGIPVGASPERLLRFDCVDRGQIRNCTLHLSNLDGTNDRVLPAPAGSDWSLTASANAGMATSLPTASVSPSGGTAVFLVESQRDSSGVAWASQFVLVDLATGATQALRDWPGAPTYWSSDSGWLVTLERSTEVTNGALRAMSVATNEARVIVLGVALTPNQEAAGGG